MIGLTAIWTSLSTKTGSAGWQTLGIYPNAPCLLRAGVKHPELLEGLLVDVPASAVPTKVEYPDSLGFVVRPELLTAGIGGTVRISLVRSLHGSADLFAILAEDISSRVAASKDITRAVATFFARIKAWQAFMHANDGDRLSAIEEVGLIGELFFLEQVLLKRMDGLTALESWQGPFDGLRDFRYGDHGIEVKTTDSPSKNTARISSLDQLDESSLLSLHLVTVKLAPSSAGITLPTLVDRIRERLQTEALDSSTRFDECLLRVGYIDAHRDRYQRQLNIVVFNAYRVNNLFPRLTGAGVPTGVRSAIYDIDLATATAHHVDTDRMLDIFLGEERGT